MIIIFVCKKRNIIINHAQNFKDYDRYLILTTCAHLLISSN